ncbi:hypothetical protein QR510_30545, partial [Escherichia coli]|uniref:hypothetical protein n=1 Tax=Escherichia coli TaxID=562 RepID=UPI0027386D49
QLNPTYLLVDSWDINPPTEQTKIILGKEYPTNYGVDKAIEDIEYEFIGNNEEIQVTATFEFDIIYIFNSSYSYHDIPKS